MEENVDEKCHIDDVTPAELVSETDSKTTQNDDDIDNVTTGNGSKDENLEENNTSTQPEAATEEINPGEHIKEEEEPRVERGRATVGVHGLEGHEGGVDEPVFGHICTTVC